MISIQHIPPNAPPVRDEIYRLRYRVYVEEMGREQPGTCHRTRRIIDPQDTTGRTFAAFDGDRIIGTVRTDYVRDGDCEEYIALYGAKAYVEQVGRARVAISGRLMVLPAYRSGRTAFRLAAATFGQALRDGIHHNLVDSNSPVEPFFLRLGYKVFRKPIAHPSYGDVAVLTLDLLDSEHLASVGSPFMPLLEKWLRARNVAGCNRPPVGDIQHVVP